MSMMNFSTEKILILGGSGMLGRSLAPFLESSGHAVVTHGHSDIAMHRADITDTVETAGLLDVISPTVIINLVGLTDVDRCETQPNQAYVTNVRTVENITDWMRRENSSCHLVHISSDQVYDGTGPHLERSVALTNFYAFSKYAGELVAARVPSTIVRTNFFGRSHRPGRESLTDWLLRAWSARDAIQVFEDVLFSPLSLTTVSRMIERAVLDKPVGVFNLGSRAGLSKADFAFAFAKEMDFDLQSLNMTRTSIAQASFLKTYRPKDMRLDCSKFERVFDVSLPLLRDEIKLAAKEYQ